MAILVVSYDLQKPGKNYQPVWDHLKKFTHCKALESFWLLDTAKTAVTVRDELKALVDANDRVFVCRMATKAWASHNGVCGNWLNNDARKW